MDNYLKLFIHVDLCIHAYMNKFGMAWIKFDSVKMCLANVNYRDKFIKRFYFVIKMKIREDNALDIPAGKTRIVFQTGLLGVFIRYLFPKT